ncbi:unnamed protein product [Larinioides sclopetarius]|uniref:Uncharacterized protein n=1 Tax=Larinioides sclopetarius TaxID=280406 RepID=A0AAV2AK21_9ARAC
MTLISRRLLINQENSTMNTVTKSQITKIIQDTKIFKIMVSTMVEDQEDMAIQEQVAKAIREVMVTKETLARQEFITIQEMLLAQVGMAVPEEMGQLGNLVVLGKLEAQVSLVVQDSLAIQDKLVVEEDLEEQVDLEGLEDLEEVLAQTTITHMKIIIIILITIQATHSILPFIIMDKIATTHIKDTIIHTIIPHTRATHHIQAIIMEIIPKKQPLQLLHCNQHQFHNRLLCRSQPQHHQIKVPSKHFSDKHLLHTFAPEIASIFN